MPCFAGPHSDGLGGALSSFTACLNQAASEDCRDTYLNGHLQQAGSKPTLEECWADYQNRLIECNYNDNTSAPLNCTHGSGVGSVTPEQKKLLIKWCTFAADMLLQHCNALANSTSTDGGAFEEGLLRFGAASTGQFDSANGVGSAEWTKVPLPQDGVEIDGAILHAMVWSENGWTWIVLAESAPSPDGMIDISMDLSQIEGSEWIDTLHMAIEWRSGNEIVGTTPIHLGFSESDLCADYNRDGIADTSDILSFVDAYIISAPRADINMDGQIDGHDLSLFLACFD